MSGDSRRFVDASVLVRYFTDDIPEQAEVAAAILESEDLLVNSVILMECGYVLTRTYGYPRNEVVQALVELLGRENIAMADMPKELAASALLSVRDSSRTSFGDALIVAGMQAVGADEIYTFDRDFKGEGIVALGRPD